ncbi:hypothetical protein [Curtobacterium sp. MCPF17_046]|uniref:hypothetical protein n=1 Tax=Curtobacterium sp. MCPF17_046 TaxID=2175663 RepID=UPI000D8CD5F4|nr:hypothetical protein [Curtobacterium sp. MCPF17_046]PYY41461.1 hypothetical protein DEJ32_03655 [Curtobacterium sp. MCPF17_046]
MSMSAPFDPMQQGSDVPVDGSDQDELEVEEARGATGGPESSGSEPSGADVSGAAAIGNPGDSPVRHDDEDEAGGGPVFRTPEPGDRLHPEDLGS